ncbi:MAG: hypothetical protein ACHQQQ_01075 [Bacteroidota bacterium]
MYRLALSIACILLFLSTSFAQDSTDEELPPPSHSAAKFGGAIGFAPSFLNMDLNSMNEVLRNANSAELSDGPMFMTGGQVYGYILFVQNLRGGIMWGSGSKSSLVTANGITRDVGLHIGFTGATIEYVIPLHSRLDISIGTMIGVGGMDLTMRRDNNTQTRQWIDLWNEFGTKDSASEFTRQLTGTFFMYEPMANVEYAALRWLGLRVGVGYLGMSGNSWKLDDKYDVLNVPTAINGKGFSINAGVFIGTFIF